MPQPCSLYLVRHAIAEERGPEYPDDSKRPLTARGIARFRKVARGFASDRPGIDLILTSPFERARHTANILAEALPGHPKVVETEALTPEAEFADLVGELSAHAGREAIALVGHDPSISEFAARLVGAKGSVEFKKGVVARIDVGRLPPIGTGPPGLAGPAARVRQRRSVVRKGRLRWLATPKLLPGVNA